MKINNITNSYQSFESKKLFRAKVSPKISRGRQGAKIDAFITEVGVDDIPELYTPERTRISRDFGENIIGWIQKTHKEKNKGERSSFFALEVPDRKGELKIRAMAMATELKKKKKMYLDFLQTFDTPQGERQIKGAGSCLLFAIVDIAKKQKSKLIDLFAVEEARDFYRQYGFIDGKYSHFELREYKYPSLLRELQKKYSIRSILKR